MVEARGGNVATPPQPPSPVATQVPHLGKCRVFHHLHGRYQKHDADYLAMIRIGMILPWR